MSFMTKQSNKKIIIINHILAQTVQTPLLSIKPHVKHSAKYYKIYKKENLFLEVDIYQKSINVNF
jgi:hypothetical protein